VNQAPARPATVAGVLAAGARAKTLRAKHRPAAKAGAMVFAGTAEGYLYALKAPAAQ
jgi:hypothetical protein